MPSKLYDHFGFIYDLLPEVNTLEGFFVYSFLTYLFILFTGWLLNPTVDKIIHDDIKSQRLQRKGDKMR